MDDGKYDDLIGHRAEIDRVREASCKRAAYLTRDVRVRERRLEDAGHRLVGLRHSTLGVLNDRLGARLGLPRAFRARVGTRAGQHCLFPSARFSCNESLDVRVRIDRARTVRGQPTGIHGGPIYAPDLTA
jgi:hypothetical protein